MLQNQKKFNWPEQLNSYIKWSESIIWSWLLLYYILTQLGMTPILTLKWVNNWVDAQTYSNLPRGPFKATQKVWGHRVLAFGLQGNPRIRSVRTSMKMELATGCNSRFESLISREVRSASGTSEVRRLEFRWRSSPYIMACSPEFQ